MKTNPKVLLVSGSSLFVHGGRERWITEVAKLLKSLCQVTVVSLSDFNEVRLDRLRLVRYKMKRHGISYHEFRVIRINLKLIKRIPTSFSKLTRIIMSHQKIYVAGDLFFGILFSLLAFLLGRRGLIIGLHVSPSVKRLQYAIPILRILIRMHVINVIHVVNIVDWIRLRRFVEDKVVYIPNFVDCSMFKPNVAKKDNYFQLLFVGALEFKKGIDVVLNIARRAKERFSDVRVVIASYGGAWENKVLDYAEKGLVEYKGLVDGEELVKLYSESHVLLMPSREEAFGLVAIEAQACGTPVISSDLPSFHLTVKEGLTGFRVRNYELDEWLNAIMKVYNLWKYDKQAYILICNNAREYVCRNFYSNIIKNIIKLILKENSFKRGMVDFTV